MSITDKSTNQESATTIPDWDHLPCVQYAFPSENGHSRQPVLRTVFAPIPEGATTASPIYKVPIERYERQWKLENPYAVRNSRHIAWEIQENAENDDRVLYPIHIESDKYHEKDPATLIEWFRQLVEDYLEVPFETCTLYFSGRRSIHVHVPRFLTGVDQQEALRKQVVSFSEETGAELDLGIYDPKQLFRLPGVEHDATGLRKVPIQADWDKNRIFREANAGEISAPDTYEEVLRRVYASQEELTTDGGLNKDYDPRDLFSVLESEKTVLELPSDASDIEVPLIEREDWPEDTRLTPKYAQYNAKEFSPYALCEGGSRSVAALRVKDSPFAKIDRTIGHSNRRIHALIPAYFYGARGCAGDEFTKNEEHAPLQLSKPDYSKWDYQESDHIVIIGGKSNSSRLISVKPREAKFTGHALNDPEGSRQRALEYLDSEGYEVGSAGRTGTVNEEKPNGNHSSKSTPNEVQGESEAKKLQTIAEEKGIGSLSHIEKGRVACRLLKFGWDPAWAWFNEQFGSGFDPQQTRSQFESILSSYPEDYKHVEVPDTLN